MRIMKAITLHQPWLALILEGVKRFETRSWRDQTQLLIGQTIALHAGSKYRSPHELPAAAAEAISKQLDVGRDWEKLPRSAVLATARLIAVHEVLATGYSGNVRSLVTTGGQAILLAPDEEHFGDYRPGRFLFELAEVRPLRRPTPARGYQKFWTWRPPSLAAVA